MKTLVVLFILFVGYSSTNNKLDESNGFENFKFDSPQTTYKNLSIEIDEGNTKLFSIATNEINIKDVEFDNIRLTFIKNKLNTIALTTKNSTGKVFLDFLKSKYGNPKIYKDNFEWMGKKVILIYQPYNSGNDAVVNFYKTNEK